MKYVKGMLNLGLCYGKHISLDLIGYTDADFTGYRVDRKSTNVTCQFLCGSLVSWSSRKQTSITLSITEVEYVVAGNYCTQLLWMIQTLKDYEINFRKVSIMCNNTKYNSNIKESRLHSKTKRIEIRYHFIRDHIEKGDVELIHVDIKN